MTTATENTLSTEEVEPIRSQEEMSQIVSFAIGNEEYGVDITRVQEVILIGKITEMPQVPPYVRGLINLRGIVIPVVDLRTRFGLETQPPTDESRIIVFNEGERTVGIMVDAVNEVLRFNAEQMETVPTGMITSGQQFVSGLIRFEDRILLQLNVANLLTEEDVTALGAGVNGAAELAAMPQTER